MASLATTLAAIRREESGSFKGDYAFQGDRGKGGTPEGAYGILDTNWSRWAASAGLAGATPRSRKAQDRVAAHVLQTYYNRYGSWELATAAWFGGIRSADIIQKRGGKIRNAQIARFVKKVAGYQKVPEVNNYSSRVPKMQGTSTTQSSTGTGNWVFPVAGENEWSRGSYMEKHTKGNRSHYAVDIYAKAGTPVVAPVSGQVLRVTENKGIGGNTIQFLGDDGITYYFAHLNSKPPYEKGQRVIAGRQIGATGKSGNVPGKAQTHFTMKRNGKPVDNRGFLAGAESVSGLYANLQYEEPAEVSAGYNQETPIGSTIPEAMIDGVANSVAGGVRLDPRDWIDPNVEELDLGQRRNETNREYRQRQANAGISDYTPPSYGPEGTDNSGPLNNESDRDYESRTLGQESDARAARIWGSG